MAEERLQGLPTRKQRKSFVNVATSEDLVCRDFNRDRPNQLWLTDITEHPTREGRVYCCVVLDAHSRMIVGWSIDSHQASSLVTNALQMAISNRTPPAGTVIHSDHGSQFTSWAFSERVRQAGLVPSMGTVGDAYDNALIEALPGLAFRPNSSTARNGRPGSSSALPCSTTSRSSTTETVATAHSEC